MDTGISTTAQGDSGSGGIIATNQEGLTLPHDIQLGDDWSQVIGFTSELFSGTIESNYIAAAYESVTVPAGTFEALRLEQTSTTTMSGYEIKSKSILWNAAGVGNIKTEIEGPAGQPTVVQLVTFNIP